MNESTKQPIKMIPGDDTHLTMLMAPSNLNFFVGKDREDLLAYGRAAFEAGKAGQCLHQIQEPAAAEQAAWHAGLDEGRAQAAQPEDARELVTLALGLSLPPKGGPSFAWAYLLSSIRELVKCEEELTLLKAGMEMSKAAPAAVAVPDERAAFEAHCASIGYSLKTNSGGTYKFDYGAELWAGWQARAALATTTAADIGNPITGTAAPVVLPEPDFKLDSGETGCFYESTVRALLATATGLPAQAEHIGHIELSGYDIPGVAKPRANIVWDIGAEQQRSLVHGSKVYLHASSLAQADARDALTPAARDVLAERQRQVSVEGRTPERDDRYSPGELLMAADSYISWNCGEYEPGTVPINWPWKLDWFKPTTERRNLEKAGALILAEIERIDRAAIAAAKGEE